MHRSFSRFRYFVFFVLSLTLSLASCKKQIAQCNNCFVSRKLKPRVIMTSEQGKKLVISVEMACTLSERSRGLMYRKKLGEFKGMLFVFPSPARQSFWMKNTFIPLDMLHINSQKTIVGIVENAKPHSLTSRMVRNEALYVLEINAFFARKYGIKSGQKVTFVDIPSC